MVNEKECPKCKGKNLWTWGDGLKCRDCGEELSNDTPTSEEYSETEKLESKGKSCGNCDYWNNPKHQGCNHPDCGRTFAANYPDGCDKWKLKSKGKEMYCKPPPPKKRTKEEE